MSTKGQLLIVLPVLVAVLLAIVFMKRGQNLHEINPGVENSIFSEDNLSENNKNENTIQSHDDFQVMPEPGNQQGIEFQNSFETDSLVDRVKRIDSLVSDQTLDTGLKIKKIVSWLNKGNTPDEIRLKLYRALVQLRPTDRIEEIFSLVEKENSLDVRLAGAEALALLGKQLIASGHTGGQLIINLLKNAGQETQEIIISKKLNSLVAYMEDALVGNKNGMITVEYLTDREAYVWDLSAKLGDRSNPGSGPGGLLDDVAVLVGQDKELLNKEYSKLNLAYLDYFSNGFSGNIPDHQDMAHFFEQTRPQKTAVLTGEAVSRYRVWLTAYSYSGERGSNDYKNFILDELREVDSPVAALVFVENGVNVLDQLEPTTRERLVNLLEENNAVAEGSLGAEVAEALDFLVQ